MKTSIFINTINDNRNNTRYSTILHRFFNPGIRRHLTSFLYIASLSFVLASCAKITEEPKSTIVSSNFYKTQNDAISAVTAVYSDLTRNTHNDHASIFNRLLVLTVGMSSDDHLPGPGATNPDVRSIAVLTSSATNGRYDELWRQHYEGINRANAAIGRIPGIEFDATLKARLINESKFLRAVYYFNLVRLWGGVPLVTEETLDLNNINVPRATADDVYKQIIQDLTDAEALPVTYTASDAGRATRGAAKALLLKVYITQEKWDLALAKFQEIKELNVYHLFNDFADIFNIAKKNTEEHIFSAQFAADGNYLFNGTGSSNVLAITSAPAAIGGFDADNPHPSLISLFQPNDKRKGVTLFDSTVIGGQTLKFAPHFAKYVDLNALSTLYQSSINIPIIRYAEVLLFKAEAENEKNGPTEEAYDAINQVRQRVGLDDLATGLSKDQFRDSVYVERRLEFAFEQIRWFDLLRTKRLVSELKKYEDKVNISEKYYLLPIPQKEVDINPALQGHQNPGWE